MDKRINIYAHTQTDQEIYRVSGRHTPEYIRGHTLTGTYITVGKYIHGIHGKTDTQRCQEQ